MRAARVVCLALESALSSDRRVCWTSASLWAWANSEVVRSAALCRAVSSEASFSVCAWESLAVRVCCSRSPVRASSASLRRSASAVAWAVRSAMRSLSSFWRSRLSASRVRHCRRDFSSWVRAVSRAPALRAASWRSDSMRPLRSLSCFPISPCTVVWRARSSSISRVRACTCCAASSAVRRRASISDCSFFSRVAWASSRDFRMACCFFSSARACLRVASASWARWSSSTARVLLSSLAEAWAASRSAWAAVEAASSSVMRACSSSSCAACRLLAAARSSCRRARSATADLRAVSSTVGAGAAGTRAGMMSVSLSRTVVSSPVAALVRLAPRMTVPSSSRSARARMLRGPYGSPSATSTIHSILREGMASALDHVVRSGEISLPGAIRPCSAHANSASAETGPKMESSSILRNHVSSPFCSFFKASSAIAQPRSQPSLENHRIVVKIGKGDCNAFRRGGKRDD